MTATRITRNIIHFWQRAILHAHKLDDRSHGWLRLIVNAAREALKPETAITAAAIAYLAIFSLFPTALLSIAMASFTLGPLVDPQLIIQKLEFIAPALGQLLGKNITEIIQARGPVTIIALFSLVWSASTIFYTLNGTLNRIWGNKRNHPFWRQRGRAILFILIFVGPILFLISIAGSLITNFLTLVPEIYFPIVSGGGLLISILLNVAFFLVLYLMLPHSSSGWREILPGALGAGLLWELAKKAFLSFVSTYISMSNLVYGSVAAIIAFLTWAYLSSLIFLFGAFLSVSYYRIKHEQKGSDG
jgi:membrane protein